MAVPSDKVSDLAPLGYAWTPCTLFYVKAGGAWAGRGTLLDL
jgi:hypothetical protein